MLSSLDEYSSPVGTPGAAFFGAVLYRILVTILP
jgi:hypothetical protein